MTASDATCVHCAFGLVPVRLRRQWVHYFRSEGRTVVCVDRHKPERLAAATMNDHGPVTVATNGPDF